MGPKTQEVKTEISRFDRINHTVKKAVGSYFERPLYYLFYGTFAGVIVSLLFGHRLPFELYLILSGLAVIQAKPYFDKPKKTKK